jgi:hypothetical protein
MASVWKRVSGHDRQRRDDAMSGEFLTDLIDHRKRVAGYMQLVAGELFMRACVHDNSKFSPAEFEAYAQAFPAFQRYAYGTEEYKAEVRKLGPAVQHHYAVNDHHPEFFAGGINDMNLVQLIELVCDWIASSERSGGDIGHSLRINKERFGITGQLYRIMENTADMLVDRRNA